MIRRHRPQGIVPLEVWDVVVDGRPVYLVEGVAVPRAIADVVALLRAGQAVRHRGHRLPALPIAHVVVGGGGGVADVVAAIAARGIDAVGLRVPVAIGLRGGRALAREVLGVVDNVLVVDVGQTSVKWFFNDRGGRVLRPAQATIEVEARLNGTLDIARAAAVEFIGAAISSSFMNMKKPDSLVLALPCEIDDDLAVAGCSYAWPAGDPDVIVDVLARAGLSDVPAVVINDAELAAVSVQEAGALPGTLVLTIGMGLGGAFIA